MTRALWLALVVSSSLTGCRDQQAACRRAIDGHAHLDTDEWVATCVRERWSDRQIDCYLRSGRGTFRSMFCKDD